MSKYIKPTIEFMAFVRHQPGTRVGAPLQERILFKFEIHGLQ